jgi:ribosomal protein S18 acetylase RimI-like enzyme
MSEDNENGSDFWQWIGSNYAQSINDLNNLLRGKKLGLEEVICIGGVNVHRSFCGKVIGKVLVEKMDNYMRQTIKRDIQVYLFTNNFYAKHIYRKFGFQSKGFIQSDSIRPKDQTIRK